MTVELDEDHVRNWFMRVDLEQARDTLRVCEGIVDARLTMQPGRKRRSDAGTPRRKDESQKPLIDMTKAPIESPGRWRCPDGCGTSK